MAMQVAVPIGDLEVAADKVEAVTICGRELLYNKYNHSYIS